MEFIISIFALYLWIYQNDTNLSNNEYQCENVTVNPSPSYVEVENVTESYGNPIRLYYFSTGAINVTYEVFDKSGNKVANGTVGPSGVVVLKQLTVGNYTVNWTTEVDGNHTPANNMSAIEILPVPTHVSVSNVTTFAGMEVTITINLNAEIVKPVTRKLFAARLLAAETPAGNPISGKVTLTLPDGTKKTVEITDGTGSTTWLVPYGYAPGKYLANVKFSGDENYLPSEGNGTITVIKKSVDIVVGNVTGKPGDDIVIPIKVIPRDGSVFNGNVTVELPDGTTKVIEIINGESNVPWKIPKDYKGKYFVKVHSNETNIYYPADGNGTVTVIVDPPKPPIDDGNKTHHNKKSIPQNSLAKYPTGNPIIALLMVLAL